MKHNRLKVVAAVARVLLAALLLICLLSTLFPGSVLASALGSDGTKACCKGKSSNHCHAPAKVKRRVVKSEVMCGLRIPATEEAASSDSDSDDLNPYLDSVSSKCSVDCCSGVAQSTRQLKRATILTVTVQQFHPIGRTSRQTSALNHSNAIELEPFSPRGPPSSTTNSHLI